MSLRFTIWFCAIVVGAPSLTACQPPTPRAVRVDAPSHAVVIFNHVTVRTVFSAFDPTEQVIQIRNLDGLLTNFSRRDR